MRKKPKYMYCSIDLPPQALANENIAWPFSSEDTHGNFRVTSHYGTVTLLFSGGALWLDGGSDVTIPVGIG